MLRDQSVESVLPLATKLTEANVVVEAIGETPLAVLKNAAWSPLTEGDAVGSLDQTSILHRTIEATRSPGLDGKVKHDTAMEDIVDVVAKTVQSNLQLAKNVVNPIIKDVVKFVDDAVAEANVKAVTLMNVVPDVYRPIWNNPQIESMVARYSQTPPSDTKVVHALPPVDPQTIADLLTTGAGRLDEEIKEWMNDLPEGYLVDVYNSFFNRAASSEYIGSKFIDFFGTQCDREAVLAIHLMARRLEKNIPEDVNMDVGEYRSYMIEVQAQSGRCLARVFETRAKEIKNKTVVKRWPAVMPENLGAKVENIIVNADIYDQWLNDGGCPEILFGAFLVDRNTVYADLIAKGEQYKKTWERQDNLLRMRASTQRFNVTLGALRKALTTQINKMEEEQLPVANRASLHERLNQFMEGVNAKDLEDIYSVAQRLVCDTLYAHTNAKDILVAMDNIGRENPDMDIREVALLATVDVVAAWVAKLMKVSVIQNNL